jgi:hypothetical protein
MVCRVAKNDERFRGLLAEDRIGNLVIAGDLDLDDEDRIEAWLDDPDQPAALLTIGWWVHAYARDRAALERLLPLIPERHPVEDVEDVGFGGVASWIRDVVAENREVTWENPCHLYHLTARDHVPARVAHEIRPLRPEHADLVNRHWEHADAPEYVRWMIERGPTAAVYEDGEPVSWAVVHSDGQMGLMHTLEGARGKGLALSVTASLAGEVLDRGGVPFLYTITENMAAQALVEKAGFRRWGDYHYFGAKLRRP